MRVNECCGPIDLQALLPAPLALPERTAEKIKDPLFRCLERELQSGSQLLERVRRELTTVVAVCSGETKQNGVIRALMTELSKGQVPKAWGLYPVPDTLSLAAWFVDFAKRCQQLVTISKTADFSKMPVWLGGLLYPEAYMTATRQGSFSTS